MILGLTCMLAPVIAATHGRSKKIVEKAKIAINLSDQQAEAIGMRIWHNECAGKVSGLTAWNIGENFASLGIGHFIWYPARKSGPFHESFPALKLYLQKNGVKLPGWLKRAKSCPWANRKAFMKDVNTIRMKELRQVLADSFSWQARFAAMRLMDALPVILAAAPPADREKIGLRFHQIAEQPLGMYALVDYVNFKGEGTSLTERYHGQGWGLLQVLQEMNDSSPMVDFSQAAAQVLTRRVSNSPPARNESQWLGGWLVNAKSYCN